MAFIKEEIEDVKIEETFRVKHEETEKQTDLMPLKEESQDLNEMEEKDQYKTQYDSITGEKSFNCSQTEKTSSQKKAQKTLSNFTCQLCRLQFKKFGHLEVHMRVHSRRKLYPCQHCGVIFNQHAHLKVHVRIHTGEKPFPCQQCGMNFRQKEHLRGHMRIHTEDKCFICPQCGDSFSQDGNFKVHMKIHSGEK
ncbi:gastrula zinc finger protein XlCGF57.1-like [Pseudorasbora parva]|uniref:gastrula zinc finger protein XlCGF57.1-like n=1 Tax=Pseudorasbora parva TaxID=51549 RepID=UPI00351EBE8C